MNKSQGIEDAAMELANQYFHLDAHEKEIKFAEIISKHCVCKKFHEREKKGDLEAWHSFHSIVDVMKAAACRATRIQSGHEP